MMTKTVRLQLVCWGIVLLLASLLWGHGRETAAQTLPTTSINTIEGLSIELYAEYDRAALLVVLTGAIPIDTPMPSVINIPIPADAEVTSVARVAADGNVVDDVYYENKGDILAIALPEHGFRIEYYQPYTTEGTLRKTSFAWEAQTVDVIAASASVWLPPNASVVNIFPPVDTVSPTTHNGTRHTLPVYGIPKGSKATIEIAYNRTSNTLISGGTLPNILTENPASATIPINETISESTPKWPYALIVGGTLGILCTLLIWWRKKTHLDSPR